MPLLRRRLVACLPAVFAILPLLGSTLPVWAADDPVAAPAATTANPVQKSGPLVVELRLPAGGVSAGKETDVRFRITDTSGGIEADKAPGVPFARVKATITGPDTKSNSPSVRSEAVAGDYVLAASFPRAGEYRLALEIAPPGAAGEALRVEFPLPVQEASGNGKEREAAPSPFALDIRLNPFRPLSGERVEIEFTVKDRASGKPVQQFFEVNALNKPMSLMIVREDLGDFYLQEPEFDENKGKFTYSFSFPNGGEWRIFAEVAPKGANEQILDGKIRVDGVRPTRTLLLPQVVPTVRADGLTLTLRPGTRLVAGKTITLPFTLTDSRGGAVADLQPWRGALAHLILIERDGKTFVHARPDELDARNGRTETITFALRFPKPGTYKAWMIVRLGGIPSFLPLVLRVGEDK